MAGSWLNRNRKRAAGVRALFHRLITGIAPRILTVILIVFLPVCVGTIVTMSLVLREASEQIAVSGRRELAVAMESFEDHITSIDSNMDSFVSDYLAELGMGTDNYDIVPYRMLQSLDEILARTEAAGYVYLYDIKHDRVFVKYQGLSDSVRGIEAKKELLSELARQREAEGYQLMEVCGADCVVKIFSYANFRIGYVFELPANLPRQLSFDPAEFHVYYSGEDWTRQLTKDGKVLAVDAGWEELTRDTLRRMNYVWQSEKLGGLSVCVQTSAGRVRALIPLGRWIYILLLGGVLLLFPFLWYMIKLEVIRPLARLGGGMRRLAEGDLGYRIEDHARRNSEEMQFLFDNFDVMADEIEKSREKDLKMVKAELDNLRLQVNPHMLLNSYNMIYSLAQTKNYTCIQDYSLYLVEYFRYVLRKNDDFVSVSAELAFIKNYIEIQKIRFPDAFVCVYQIEEACMDAEIPPLLIENFVENSMKYALIPGRTIEILLNIRREEDMLLISISDTGRGIRPEVLKALRSGEPYVDRHGNKHIGIVNCMRRVEVFYDRKAQLSITSARDEGTQVFLRVPYRERKEGSE